MVQYGYAPVAQLDRASDCGSDDCGFKSRRVRMFGRRSQVAHGAGLENRAGRKTHGGSNPPASAASYAAGTPSQTWSVPLEGI
jgi:hypothetical protein